MIALLAALAFGGLEDAKSLTRRDDGRFDVECRDGSRSTVTVADVRGDNVCGSASGRIGLVCTKDDRAYEKYKLSRSSDGWQFGDSLDRDVCEQRVAEAREGLVCSKNPEKAYDSWYLTRTRDGGRLGAAMTEADCMDRLVETRDGMACAKDPDKYDAWWVVKTSDGARLGSRVSLEACQSAIETARPQ